jgi:flagellar hook protein FlgE
MGFQQGLSGLNSASKSLEAIGNNVSNAGTVGFKQSQAQFADVYASSLQGAGGAQIGIGSKLARVSQQFTQGNITGSNNPLDMAINGSGFFRLSNGGEVTYSRNGQFQLDKDGFIQNAAGARVTGYAANTNGVVSNGAPVELSISNADLAPQATTEYDAVLNLDSRKPVLPANGFRYTDPATFHNSTSVPVYDSLGNTHVLQTFYVKSGPGTWNVYGTSDGVPINPAVAGVEQPIAQLNFSTGGVMTSTTPSPIVAPIAVTSGAASPFNVTVDFLGTTQFGSSFSVNAQQQNGYTSGSLTGFSVSNDGKIVGRYTNGKANVLGQIALADFANPNGLQSQGNNVWVETSTSGVPLVATPTSSGMGALQSSAVEDSNVDLTAELVNMITAQRMYQANAQTIKTEDQIMQTLVNLR